MGSGVKSVYSGGRALWEEFKLFIKKGNIFTLAIGFIFGLQFNAVVKSLTDDVRRIRSCVFPSNHHFFR